MTIGQTTAIFIIILLHYAMKIYRSWVNIFTHSEQWMACPVIKRLNWKYQQSFFIVVRTWIVSFLFCDATICEEWHNDCSFISPSPIHTYVRVDEWVKVSERERLPAVWQNVPFICHLNYVLHWLTYLCDQLDCVLLPFLESFASVIDSLQIWGF
jgi:hypothetical protein